jgi:hypothetical protein
MPRRSWVCRTSPLVVTMLPYALVKSSARISRSIAARTDADPHARTGRRHARSMGTHRDRRSPPHLGHPMLIVTKPQLDQRIEQPQLVRAG